jgi:hypothetical protein
LPIVEVSERRRLGREITQPPAHKRPHLLLLRRAIDGQEPEVRIADTREVGCGNL